LEIIAQDSFSYFDGPGPIRLFQNSWNFDTLCICNYSNFPYGNFRLFM